MNRALLTTLLLTPMVVLAAERPDLTNTRVASPFAGNGHNSTVDGRIFIANVGEDHTTVTTTWRASVFRPEALSYDAEGRPELGRAFSTGRTLTVGNGENALAFCFEDPAHPWTLEGGLAVYRPWIIDSRMYGEGADYGQFRRRRATVKVRDPFTASAEIASFELGALEAMTLSGGGRPTGIEPTMTGDGRLLLYQGHPNNDGRIDHLMYSWNPSPCAAGGWSAPRPLSALHADPNAELQRYGLARGAMFAADGSPFGERDNLILAAYPWVDPEGRNVFYASVPNPLVGGRREAVSVIGADTGWTAYHIDGSINAERDNVPKLFYSGPMWMLEQERWDADRSDSYLPVTKIHDVVPLFGSNTSDYNEVDLGELLDPYHVLYLPMNELVTRGGEYDLRKTPDLSGRHQTGRLLSGAEISATHQITSSTSLWSPHGRGKALVMAGKGGVKVDIAPGSQAPMSGFTLELSLRPATSATCSPHREMLVYKRGVLEVAMVADGTVGGRVRIGSRWVNLPLTPPLPRDTWSHVAFTWDGVGGGMEAYVNGLPVGAPTSARGTFRLGPGAFYVGTSGADGTSCADGAPFEGAVDEVILFSHARSARSICQHARGVDCLEEAIQEDPSAGQLVLTNLSPTCRADGDLASLGCATAMHRVCAQAGAIESLDEATDLWDMAVQLVSGRPPIPLAGVPAGSDAEGLTVACTPIDHESLALTFDDLRVHHADCDERAPLGGGCTAATHRFCNSRGYTSGAVFDVTARAWISCFDAELQADVPRAELGAPCSDDALGAGCRLQASAWCQTRGYSAGLIQELPSDALTVHCFSAPLVDRWSWSP